MKNKDNITILLALIIFVGCLSNGESNDSGIKVIEFDDDTDRDGLTDSQEAILGSDPYQSDSDNDGLIDSEDPNPLVAETSKPAETRRPVTTPPPTTKAPATTKPPITTSPPETVPPIETVPPTTTSPPIQIYVGESGIPYYEGGGLNLVELSDYVDQTTDWIVISGKIQNNDIQTFEEPWIRIIVYLTEDRPKVEQRKLLSDPFSPGTEQEFTFHPKVLGAYVVRYEFEVGSGDEFLGAKKGRGY